MKKDWVLAFFLITASLLSYIQIIPDQITLYLLVSVCIIATIPVVINAFLAIKKRKISVDLLASIALVVSMIHSEWVSVAFINLMITCARIFGEYTEGKARSSIKSLLKLRPEKVKIRIGNNLIVKPVEEVQISDMVIIEAGERVPIDGSILEGEGTVDQSSLTGESLPIEKKKGDMLLSSTLVTSGTFLVRTEKIGKDTTFEKIVSLVENAQAGKAGIQTFADVFASWYIAITLVGSLLLYAITKNIGLVLSVLLVTCADDIAVAVPIAFWAAIAYAAKRGLIIKGGNYLEGMTKVKKILFDKTGTLTKGHITVRKIYTFHQFSEMQVLRLASYASSISEHPLSKAITEFALSKHIREHSPDSFQEIPGRGIKTKKGTTTIYVGNARFMEQNHISLIYEQTQTANKASTAGEIVVYIGANDVCVGLFLLSDEPRIGVRHTMQKLHELGIRETIMLTGDNERVAQHVMDETGITSFYANLLPEEKVRFVKNNIHKRNKVAFIGDGVNDAAALAAADIGIAMGAIGSDAAIESADIALMHDDLHKLPELILIGKYVMNVTRQNFIIWGIVNSIGLVLVFGKIIGPTEAAAFNFITDFFPLINSMRLFHPKSFKYTRLKNEVRNT